MVIINHFIVDTETSDENIDDSYDEHYDCGDIVHLIQTFLAIFILQVMIAEIDEENTDQDLVDQSQN